MKLLKRKLNLLVYGENGIGKSTAMKNTLIRNPDFLYIEDGIELVKNLVPDYDSKNKSTFKAF
jgi:predicted ABC-type ATPase